MESKYNFDIPLCNSDALKIPLKEGSVVFVLGANGVGKSTLMTRVYGDNSNHSMRILAHRQTWFTDNSSAISSNEKNNNDNNIRSTDANLDSRWCDHRATDRLKNTLFNLTNSENLRARKIVNELSNNNKIKANSLLGRKSAIEEINELLALSNIPIIITLNDKDEFLASKQNSQFYSIAELSDGERNALLICADVLTVESDQLIILDEPERHLHRSIISPLLTALFNKRRDCVFVVSTHDVHLPIDNPDCSVVLVRECKWNHSDKKWMHNAVECWKADFISDVSKVPNDVKQSILGSKQKVLFVEGKPSSLDKQFYQLIYPELSVIDKDGCKAVVDSVKGIRGVDGLIWVKSYGLIDTDDRTEEQVQSLLEDGIATTKAYSVESLYYRIEIVRKVAEKYAQLISEDGDNLYEAAISKIIEDFEDRKNHFTARLCEKQVREVVMTKMPKYKDIITGNTFSINIDLNESYLREQGIAEMLIQNNDLNGIISRYPIRESQIISNIVKGIGISRDAYENIVRKLVIDEVEVREFYRGLLKPLTDMLS